MDSRSFADAYKEAELKSFVGKQDSLGDFFLETMSVLQAFYNIKHE